MVKGLDVFRERLGKYSAQYVLIGGTAAASALTASGIGFRSTKDLDIVLHVEALTPEFGEALWSFIGEGKYAGQEQGETRKVYRFQKPANPDFPAMLEFFSRAPENLVVPPEAVLTPIPLDEELSSLSAILLDDNYYDFIVSGRIERDGLPMVGHDRLIPLKALAWLNLTASKGEGRPIDDKNIRKHASDVLRLSQLLTEDASIAIPKAVGEDLQRFVKAVLADGSYDPGALGIRNLSAETIMVRIAKAYGIA